MSNKRVIKIVFVLLSILWLLCAKTSETPTQPNNAGADISNVSGKIKQSDTVTIAGSGFGTKTIVSPWRTSFLNPIPSMNFQENGSFNNAYWAPNTQMVTLHDSSGNTRINRKERRYSARLEYSKRGNYSYQNASCFSAGINIDLPQTGDDYAAWWEYWGNDADFSMMKTGAVNVKIVYYSPGQKPAKSICVLDNGQKYFTEAGSGKVGGASAAEQDMNLYLPFGGAFYGRPISWTMDFPVILGNWYFIESFDHFNRDTGVYDGWSEMRINNQVIFRAQHIDYFGTGVPKPGCCFKNIRLGGNYTCPDTNSSKIFYRYFSDIYIDGTFARVVLGDSSQYNASRHLELQMPVNWEDTVVKIIFNQGSFLSGQTAYLFIVDENNNCSLSGFKIKIQ